MVRAADGGGIFRVLERTCTTLQNLSLLELMGFSVEFSGFPKDLHATDERVVDQDILARQAMALLISCLRQRLFSMTWHTSSWPGMLAGQTS